MQHQHVWLVDRDGQPFDPHIQQILTSLTPGLLRQFPTLRDESLMIAALETAARRITNRERRSGPIERLHGYARVTLQNIAKSLLRHGRGRLAQMLWESDEQRVSLEAIVAAGLTVWLRVTRGPTALGSSVVLDTEVCGPPKPCRHGRRRSLRT